MKSKENQVVEKKRKERFESLPTHLKGIQLRAEPGTKLDNRRRITEKLYRLARYQVKAQQQINNLSHQQSIRRKGIINTEKSYDGLRGIISEKDNFVLTVFPSEKVIWDQEMLKKSMDLAYPMAVTEIFTVSVSVPSIIIPDKKRTPIKKEAIEKAIRKALINLGIPKKYLAKMIQKEVKIDVNEERLQELITLGQVKLLPKTKKSEITWKLRIDQLKS